MPGHRRLCSPLGTLGASKLKGVGGYRLEEPTGHSLPRQVRGTGGGLWAGASLSTSPRLSPGAASGAESHWVAAVALRLR